MPKDDCYAYVRKYYGVPAFVGQRVRVRGRDGVLVFRRTSDQYVYIRFGNARGAEGPFHPTDEIEYAPADGAMLLGAPTPSDRCTCTPVTAAGVMVQDPHCAVHGQPRFRVTVDSSNV